jgi:hypothetical protein
MDLLTAKRNDQSFLNRLMAIHWDEIIEQVIEQKRWDRVTAEQAVQKYQSFLVLIHKYPHISMVPNQEIDVVAHIHIGITSEHEKRCFDCLGVYLHHVPGLGTRGKADRQRWLDMFARTRTLFEAHFGQAAMGQSPPASCEIFELRLAT